MTVFLYISSSTFVFICFYIAPQVRSHYFFCRDLGKRAGDFLILKHLKGNRVGLVFEVRMRMIDFELI